MTEKVHSIMTRMHPIMPGDTLPLIAEKYYGDATFVADLARVNGISENAVLTIGKKIKIPAKERLRNVTPKRELADINSDPVITGAPLDTFSITAAAPWYANKTLWIAAAAGFLLAYFLTGKKGKGFFG